MERAMFGAGCFWGVESAFREVKGVESTTSGYSGGSVADPTYEEVCTGTTGHAEVVLLEFNPEVVSYEALLALFWKMHDPTTLNQQGPDIGTQYRSAIYFYTEAQEAAALLSKSQLETEGGCAGGIVTEITAVSEFYAAEEYHQCYLEKQGLGRCH